MSTDSRPNAATQAKKRWNARHYTVIKVSAAPDIAAAFKAECAASNVSMNGVLTQFMSKYGGMAVKRGPEPDYSIRRKRRLAVKCIAEQIGQIRDAEERYRDSIPGNLQGSTVYEMADECVSMLEEAAELLGSIY